MPTALALGLALALALLGCESSVPTAPPASTPAPAVPAPAPEPEPEPEAERTTAPTLTLDRLTPGLHVWRPTRQGRQTVGSAGGFIETLGGLVMIDACQTPEGARAALAAMDALGPRPLRAIVITHPHEDHEGGLAALFPLRTQRDPSEVRVVRHPLTEPVLTLAEGVTVEHPGPAHTAADLCVWVQTPEGLALFAGDVYVNGYIGYLGEGHLKEWAAALRQMAERGPRWVIGGHGPIGDAAGLKAYADYIDDFRQDARRHFAAGRKPSTYRLPGRWDRLGARSFLRDNAERAYALWRAGEL